MHHMNNGGFAYGVDRLTIGDLLLFSCFLQESQPFLAMKDSSYFQFGRHWRSRAIKPIEILLASRQLSGMC